MRIGLKLFPRSNLNGSLGIFRKQYFLHVCVCFVEELKRRTIRASYSFIYQTSGYCMRAGQVSAVRVSDSNPWGKGLAP